MERVKGIEPSYAAWEAAVLPLNYTRVVLRTSCSTSRETISAVGCDCSAARAWRHVFPNVSGASARAGRLKLESLNASRRRPGNQPFASMVPARCLHRAAR
jgi:hypothetical protein